MKNYRQLIHDDIRNLGIADNFLGEECLYLALDILKDNPMRLCCISKSMYFDMADAMDTTTCSRSKFLSKLLKTFDKTFREIFPVFISTKRREKPSAFF